MVSSRSKIRIEREISHHTHSADCNDMTPHGTALHVIAHNGALQFIVGVDQS